MLLTEEKRSDFMILHNQVERLYLVQYLEGLRNLIICKCPIPNEELRIISGFLNSGLAHYKGEFLQFNHLETSEVFSLISKSLVSDQIIKFSFEENVQFLLKGFNTLSTIKDEDREILINFLNNLIYNLSTKDYSSEGNYFDW